MTSSDSDLLLRESYSISRQFALTFEKGTGEAIAYCFSAPEYNVRLSEQARRLFSLFSAVSSLQVKSVLDDFCRLNGLEFDAVRPQLVETVQRLVEIGILTSADEDETIYSAEMLESYAKDRAIPPQILQTIVKSSGMREDTSVLDICTGPGTIALQLARISSHVVGIDLSVPFLSYASAKARELGLSAEFRRECANKLVFQDRQCDLAVLSQGFDWLDKPQAVRGMHHVLREHGDLYVLESKPLLPMGHPLRRVIPYAFVNVEQVKPECTRHTREYAALFRSVVCASDIFDLVQAWIFRQPREFGPGYARAFVSPTLLRRVYGDTPEQIFEAAANYRDAEMFWLLMRFRKTGMREPSASAEIDLDEVSIATLPDPSAEPEFV